MHEIEIETDVAVPMRDGTILRADIYRPCGGGRYPVLLSRSSYGKSLTFDAVVDVKTSVKEGYVIIQQDTRGRFASDGEWIPWRDEREDGYDTVEWAAALPYSNGRVGVFGPSYLGNTQWNAVVAQPPHLQAIVPFVTFSDPEDGVMFRGGAIELGLNAWWAHTAALAQVPKLGLGPDELTARASALLRSIDTLADDGIWGLSGALPALVATGLPDIGVTRALADRSTTDECRVSNRYDDVRVPSLNLPDGTIC